MCSWLKRPPMTGASLQIPGSLTVLMREIKRWTGEIDGRRGLIPAAYVKVL